MILGSIHATCKGILSYTTSRPILGVSLPVGTVLSFRRVKATRKWIWPLTSTYCRV